MVDDRPEVGGTSKRERSVLGDTLIERLFHLLITGDAPRARALIEQTLAHGASADELIIETFRPIATMIESLCRADQLTHYARDHATVLLQNLLDDARVGRFETPAHESCMVETTRPWTQAKPGQANPSGAESLNQTTVPGSASSQFVKLSYREGKLVARPVGPNVGPRQAPIVREEIDRALDLVSHGLRVVVIDLGEVETMSF